MDELTVGARIKHATYGEGTLSVVGPDYVGLRLDDGNEVLIRRATLVHEVPDLLELGKAPSVLRPWPASTFVSEDEDAMHFQGAHWEPFATDVKEVVGSLPQIISEMLLQASYSDNRKPTREAPEDWPVGFMLVWPLRVRGLATILRMEKEANMVVSLFPFFAEGTQLTLELREVVVWESGLEAQTSATWGDVELTFFDTQYPMNRAWYETGKRYDFILSGLAYSARPAGDREWTVDQHPEVVAWVNRTVRDGEDADQTMVTVSLDGAAILLPVDGWDVDDYSFRGPVKSVDEFKSWLGQDGWRVRVTVMRCGDEDADLDILVTRHAWAGGEPPCVGQDIEGRLWLQGYLWMPK